MNIVIIMMLFLGAVSADSPVIDAGAIIEGFPCETLSYNGIPICGKYPGDMPDIGAWEWFPGVTAENPKGDWDGTPLTYNPLLPRKKPVFPKELRINK
jgi:hypothetical protein